MAAAFFGAAFLAAGAALASDNAIDGAGALDGFSETGEVTSCVPMRSTDIEAIDENRLLFKVGARYYINETNGTCERAQSRLFRLEARIFSSNACLGDIFNVVDNQTGAFIGACSLGEFRKLERKPADPASTEKTR